VRPRGPLGHARFWHIVGAHQRVRPPVRYKHTAPYKPASTMPRIRADTWVRPYNRYSLPFWGSDVNTCAKGGSVRATEGRRQIVLASTFDRFLSHPTSHTARFLREHLA